MANDDTKRLRLVLDIEYQLNGASEAELRDMLEDSVKYAMEQGLLTQETPAEIVEWKAKITKVE
jgi:hypothetical protein